MFPTLKQPALGIFIKEQLLELSKYSSLDLIVPVPFLKNKYLNNSPSSAFKIILPRFISWPGNSFILIKLFSIGVSVVTAALYSIVISNEKYRLINCHFALTTGIPSLVLGKIFKIPVIVTIHGADCHINSTKYIQLLIVKFVLKRASKIIAVSNNLKKEASAIYGIEGDKIQVIHNGVSSLFINDNSSKASKHYRILSVGNVCNNKGQKRVVEALSLVSKKINMPISYTVVGDNIDDTELVTEEIQIDNQKINIHRHRSVNKENLINYYSNCDIFVLPSIKEGFGIAFIEAMCFGVPVVGPKGQGPSEFIVDGKNGFLVNPISVKDIALKILLCKNKVWDREFIRNSVNVFTWGNVCKQTLDVYNDVLNSNV